MPPLIPGIQQQSWQAVIQKELAAAASAAASDIGGRLKDTAFLKTVTELAVQQSQFPYLIQTNPPGISAGNAGLAILFAMLDTCFLEQAGMPSAISISNWQRAPWKRAMRWGAVSPSLPVSAAWPLRPGV